MRGRELVVFTAVKRKGQCAAGQQRHVLRQRKLVELGELRLGHSSQRDFFARKLRLIHNGEPGALPALFLYRTNHKAGPQAASQAKGLLMLLLGIIGKLARERLHLHHVAQRGIVGDECIDSADVSVLLRVALVAGDGSNQDADLSRSEVLRQAVTVCMNRSPNDGDGAGNYDYGEEAIPNNFLNAAKLLPAVYPVSEEYQNDHEGAEARANLAKDSDDPVGERQSTTS